MLKIAQTLLAATVEHIVVPVIVGIIKPCDGENKLPFPATPPINGNDSALPQSESTGLLDSMADLVEND